jgi:hypothetical protein
MTRRIFDENKVRIFRIFEMLKNLISNPQENSLKVIKPHPDLS